MPCHFRFASELDQNEIEKRAKENMYFYARGHLSPEQCKEFERQGLPDYPEESLHEDLCKLCKILTESEMKYISALYIHLPLRWSHKTLYDWYLEHKRDDEYYNSVLSTQGGK